MQRYDLAVIMDSRNDGDGQGGRQKHERRPGDPLAVCPDMAEGDHVRLVTAHSQSS
jgi:hypothetical protein